MKNYVKLLSCFIFTMSVFLPLGVQGQMTTAEDHIEEECRELSVQDRKLAERMVEIMKTKGHALDAIGGKSPYQKEQAKKLREQTSDTFAFMLSEVTVTDCQTIIPEGQGTMSLIRSYLSDLKAIASTTNPGMIIADLPVHAKAENAGLQLQHHFASLLGSYDTLPKRYGYTINNTIEFSIKDNVQEDIGEGKIDIVLDLLEATDEKVAQILVDIVGETNGIYTYNKAPFSLGGAIGLDIRHMFDTTYLGFTKAYANVIGNDSDLDQIRSFVALLQTYIQDNTFIIIPEDPSNPFTQKHFIEEGKLLNIALHSDTPLIRFFTQKGDTYYGSINPAFCEQLGQAIKENCRGLAFDMFEEFGEQGFFALSFANDGSAQIKINEEIIPADIETIFKTIILATWNTENINTLHIPFSEPTQQFQGFMYDQGSLSFFWEIDGNTITFDGQHNEKTLSIQGKANDQNMENSFTFSMYHDYASQKGNYTISMDMYNTYNKQTLQGSINGTIQPRSYSSITQPSNTILADDAFEENFE